MSKQNKTYVVMGFDGVFLGHDNNWATAKQMHKEDMNDNEQKIIYLKRELELLRKEIEIYVQRHTA